MTKAISIALVREARGADAGIQARILCHRPKLLGHAAEFRLVMKVKVHDSRGIHAERILHRHAFTLVSRETLLTIPRSALQAFSYRGEHIDIELHTVVKVDDGILFDTKVSQQQQIQLALRPAVTSNAREIVDPNDVFSFAANLGAIPAANRLITLALAIAGGAAIALNMVVGIHDQFSFGHTFFYDHVSSDGDSESPLVKALVGSGVVGAIIWGLIRNQLKKYMTLILRTRVGPIRRNRQYRVSELFTGKSRVPLENIRLRLVACNMEKGQYERGSGTKRRTVSFSEPVRGVVLYDKFVAYVPRGMPVESYFNDNVSFDPMFKVLYPPSRCSDTHGLDVHWELQLLHPQFVDHQVDGNPNQLYPEDFHEA